VYSADSHIADHERVLLAGHGPSGACNSQFQGIYEGIYGDSAPNRSGRITVTPGPKWNDLMYHQMISQCTQSLKTLETCLDKAERHAAAKKFDAGVLMASRLAPDMQPFTYQVQSACDYVKLAAAWLSGETPPKHEDNEQTSDELRVRIRKTVAFAESVKEAQYAGAGERKVSLSWAPGKVMNGQDYLLQMTMPNTYFHIAMAYAILRHNGVDVGKMDFLGPINLVDA
ncbi:MAG TPA: DUF1993 domain-containing protein, partial [Caulobacteraceae bacterium]